MSPCATGNNIVMKKFLVLATPLAASSVQKKKAG